MEKQYDIRQDEEQEKKSQEVLELLVTAGYFRARIKVKLDPAVCILNDFITGKLLVLELEKENQEIK